MAKRKRRIRSPHPGVKIKRRKLPSGGTSWRAHYLDPDTGREAAITLDALALPTAEARTAWAKALAQELAHKRMNRVAGATSSPLEAAIKTYLDDASARLRPKTIETHELALSQLRAWAKANRVQSTADLTRPRLAMLREYLVRLPKRTAAKGAGRGASRSTSKRRSPMSVNRELSSIKAVLNTWRTRELIPNLHKDDITDALAALPTAYEEPPFLRPAEIKALLAAAMRHDAATFAETREEHAGKREKGTTLRHTPIAPFVAFLLLTGCRRGEALALAWPMVHLDALDNAGRVVGEIRLPASIIKTHRARTIGLEVSPALRKILSALRLREEGDGAVFGYTAAEVENARARMLEDYGAPTFDWQSLRSTCATYLTNAPGIFGAATVFLSARQLGHSVAVAERHYLGTFRGIAHDARTLEAAMQCERELASVVSSLVSAPARRAAK